MKPKAKVCKEELKKCPLIFFFLGFYKRSYLLPDASKMHDTKFKY